MYRGFNVNLDWYEEQYYQKGLILHQQNKKKIEETLNSFILTDGSLDGSKMQSDWFPEIKADIFISHSHHDRKQALALAAWIQEKFKLTCFIDSYVWGYADNLLKIIDKVYCRDDESGLYSYQLRNRSTSHVHMMLSMALMKMMDSTECLFFINTPESITPDSVINETTSPWIYAELAMTTMLKENVPPRLTKSRLVERYYGADGLEEIRKALPDFRYKVGLDHLIDLSEFDLMHMWIITHLRGSHALDTLYSNNS